MQYPTRQILSLAAAITMIAACKDGPTAPSAPFEHSEPLFPGTPGCDATPDWRDGDRDTRFLILPCDGEGSDPSDPTLDVSVDAPGLAPSIPATAAASRPVRTVREWVTDFTDGNTYWSYDCDPGFSESIRMDGIIRHRMTFMEGPDGRFQARHQSTAHGVRGVGLTSGEVYRVKDRTRSVTNQVKGALTNSHRSVMELIGTESGRGFRQILIRRFTFNANGELTMGRETTTFECLP